MFAQVFPLFQDTEPFQVLPVMYKDGFMNAGIHPTEVNPTIMGVSAMIALVVNVVAFASIIKCAKKLGINPYKQEVWVSTHDFVEAMVCV
ncbi:hypothetical protein SAMN05421767_12014 [Granulicatella balaenopterae]|uniref:Uncharacterized protein n=1 Tax=Granulicatella balaenopterae TaxID=137733 RepID=A0A1H9LL46_9LACT|nr:hypothetical protein SAMN05421767_12014 [Granulicatella balaenopterae]